MSATSKPQLRVVTPQSATAERTSHALIDLYKAVKGAGYYPAGHPSRRETVQQAFRALAPLCAERGMVLSVTRQGFARGGEALEGGTMTAHLARECILRRIRTITFLKELQQHEVATFVELLVEEPPRVNAAGIVQRMEQAGVVAIRVNEPEMVPERQSFSDPSTWEAPEEELPPIEEILKRMEGEREDGRYQELGRMLVLQVRRGAVTPALLPVLTTLVSHHLEDARTPLQREFALFLLEHLADGAGELLLDTLLEPGYPDKEGIHRILKALGGKGAYWIVQRVCLAQGLHERKALAAALVHLGARAVPPVVALLKDERPSVVRNMVSIAGELARPECVPPLRQVLHHEDIRVRKEAIRSLMKCGGDDAEGALMALLEENDEGLVRQAIICLGLMRSRNAVVPLVRLVEKRDLLLKTLGMKKDALTALGRIGDRRVTPLLMRVLSGWFGFGKREELKIAVAAALGALGDEAALPLLRRKAAGSGRLAEACGEAVENMERLFGAGHD